MNAESILKQNEKGKNKMFTCYIVCSVLPVIWFIGMFAIFY